MIAIPIAFLGGLICALMSIWHAPVEWVQTAGIITIVVSFLAMGMFQ